MAGPVTSVTITGLNKTVRHLRELGVEVDDLKDVFQAIAIEAAAVIRPGVPVRSGRMLGTLRPNRAQNRAVVTMGRASVPYAPVINYGWPRRHIIGQRFMQRADRYRDRWVSMVEQGIDDAIKRKGLG